ncbi:universal stress protein [Methanosarcina sp. 2.H.A.1B.4]|uniref:universal stress protein n=1 Tax=Methanosarcina sp. 2.H.A.1B.4 TaxID=1483600 RepID=UPI0006213FBF|nr:universal stress protein [Methanosarcina sp. 2.H.A.1B.4]KKG11492.1 universal stress protein [Methanosarcina sp. 2.H.A.1B.4]
MKRKPYRKILLATDGSENAKSAACSGLEIARNTGAEIYAVYVAGISCCSPIMPESYDWEIGKEGSEAVAEIEEMGRENGVTVNSVLLQGNPAQEILDFAEKNDIDMIVMGTQGKAGIDRFLLGGVTEKVVRHAKAEVLVVRAPCP